MYVAKLLDRTDLGPALDRFHEKLGHSFEEVITDELRKKMEPIDE